MKMRGKKLIFSYRDVWNLDSTLVPIIAEGVKRFRDIESDYKGIPNQIVYEIFGKTNDQLSDEQMIEAKRSWNQKLDFIYDSLTRKMPDYEGEFTEGEFHGNREEGSESSRWDMRTDPVLWKKYTDEQSEWAYNRNLAMEYVAEYLFDMWW